MQFTLFFRIKWWWLCYTFLCTPTQSRKIIALTLTLYWPLISLNRRRVYSIWEAFVICTSTKTTLNKKKAILYNSRSTVFQNFYVKIYWSLSLNNLFLPIQYSAVQRKKGHHSHVFCLYRNGVPKVVGCCGDIVKLWHKFTLDKSLQLIWEKEKST